VLTADGYTPWLLRPTPTFPRPPSNSGWLFERVLPPPSSVREHIEAQGLKPAEARASQFDLFGSAGDMIGLVPTLAAVVASGAKTIHLLEAEPGYDVSHSEPRWDTRIFVSVPDEPAPVGGLRLAESVVHEAMHLDLTAFESDCPVVADEAGSMKSPWRAEPRPFGGIAHGLYVFVGLQEFFTRLVAFDLGAGSAHVQQRIEEIRSEISTIDLDYLVSALTPTGALLARAWRNGALVPRSGRCERP
jgi:HEXXH motif-containing protein